VPRRTDRTPATFVVSAPYDISMASLDASE
jgi:hypothetical protein